MSDNSSEHNNQGRRRRSRGGRGRHQHNRQSQGNGPQGGGNRNRQPRQAPAKKKPKTLWQKILGFFGFGKKEETKPQRREERPQAQQQPQQQPIKSNTRNAKTGGGERQERGEKRQPRRPDPASVENGRLYVGNLSYDATEHDIEELFKGVGGVRSVEVVYNRRTHRSKGYGFVQMQNLDEARRAVEVLHDQFFMGRKLVVNAASSHGPRADEDDDGEETPKPTSEEQAA